MSDSGNEDLNTLHNRLVWFDLGVKDLQRAAEFYRAVLAKNITIEQFDNFEFGVFEHDKGIGGCLVPTQESPSTGNLLIYFNVDGRIQAAISEVTNHGGEVVENIHAIGPHGFRAIIIDSEGNKIALHSNSNE
ncbi:VOC family protein [Aliikangiella coralliicola]|uniref:VOC family protein n=1 Tax=Aliikangiella coralliicola TaxID=2592383 RepID=A0A545UAE0_9GAMM|nr:VOC family protein [Aliikangiella coralliicola]TQV86419.1 VOC family protein [Aliikangiella coralliicola]